jgi:hypothetical protein
MTEVFKKSWLTGWTRSSAGYSVRVGSRTGIMYRDQSGELRIDSEAMAGPELEVVVYVGSIPDDDPERLRAEVLERLKRVFAYRGWKLTAEDAGFD